MSARTPIPWLVGIALACVALACVGLGGCNVGPTYQEPIVAGSLDHWGGAVDASWWRRFHDPELNSLVVRYADQNLDLKSAAERVIQGTRQQQVAASRGIPHVDGQSNTDYVRASPNSVLSLVTPSPNAPLQFGFFNDGLNAS